MWGAGFAAGIGAGFALGLVVGSLSVKQKSWSELTEKERKSRMIAIGAGFILLLSGIAVFLWLLLSR